MGLRLGVDVGGTFTDLFLIDEATGAAYTAKVPSTPDDSSVGVLSGIRKLCREHQIELNSITHVMHGTTVATNAVLTGVGARVGLVVTDGYRQILHMARSWVPGGLGAWINFTKSKPMAPLKWTVEAHERVGADGTVVRTLDEARLREDLKLLKEAGVEAITVAFLHSYANHSHEQRARELIQEEIPGVSVSISSETVTEMQEYERAFTTVANSFVKPNVSRYMRNLHAALQHELGNVKLHILRSDGGLASAETAAEYPVRLLMSGPAGGVSGAIWIAKQANFPNILTFDMGGTSTDVALVQNGKAAVRRETIVGDVSVRASSIDVRSVGAGGGSIASVPELTKALRVGPQSAGAVPGPAAYNKGGTEPTVTDAHVVLGYLPLGARLGGDMQLSRDRSVAAVQKIATAIGLTLEDAAEGIIRIVNEKMFGALRLVSVEQGYDPRDFALMAFGGAGPLHANDLGRLLGAWPVIIPRGPGVLCASGDATTRLRDESSRTYIRLFSNTSETEVNGLLVELAARAARSLDAEGVLRSEQETVYEADVRYSGQALEMTIAFTLDDLAARGLMAIGERFDELHEQYYTFRLKVDKEIVALRSIVQGQPAVANAEEAPIGNGDPSNAVTAEQEVYIDSLPQKAKIYDRYKLKRDDRVVGPAIVTEMDSTTLILPRHVGVVDRIGNILIRPADA